MKTFTPKSKLGKYLHREDKLTWYCRTCWRKGFYVDIEAEVEDLHYGITKNHKYVHECKNPDIRTVIQRNYEEK